MILRNLYAPQFLATPYTQTIREDASVGSQVLVVNATDQDIVVSAQFKMADAFIYYILCQ